MDDMRIEKLLRRLEWSGRTDSGDEICPECKHFRNTNGRRVDNCLHHASGCEMGEAILHYETGGKAQRPKSDKMLRPQQDKMVRLRDDK